MTDLEFVQRCAKGDKLAWNEFIDRYSRLIYNYIHSVLKIKGYQSLAQDSINDLFQEIFLSLVKDNFRKLRTFRAKNSCSLASWLRQVTINFTIDYIRKFKPTVSIDEETEEGFSIKDLLADGSVSVADNFTREEKVSHLKDCIGKLDTHDKHFLELYINIGLGLDEIKDIFKISRGAVDMRKARILDRLRDCFKSKGFVLDF